MATTAMRRRRWARSLGLVLGAGVALYFINLHRVPGGSGTPGARITMVARSLGEFKLDPVLPFLVSPTMHAEGGSAEGGLSISNISPKAHLIRMKPTSASHDLDGLVRISVSVGDEVLFDGLLSEFATKVRPFILGIAERKDFSFEVHLPKTTESNVVGRIADIEINFNIERSGPNIESLSEN